jgi:hypothetical protein
MVKKQKNNNFIIAILTIVVTVLTFIFVINPSSSVFAAVPAKVENLSASFDRGVIVLTWTIPRGSVADGFYILKNNPNETLDTRSSQHSFEIKNITEGIEYTFAVAAYNKNGIGEYSDVIRLTPGTALSVPATPEITSITSSDGEITIFWDPPQSDGGSPITLYEIEYVNTRTRVRETKTSSRSGSLGIGMLTNGDEYAIKMRAQNNVGFSDYSQVVMATPQLSISFPEDLTGVSLSESISLSWTAPLNSQNFIIDGYVIGLSRNKETEIFLNIPNDTNYTIPNLVNGIVYDVRIAARVDGEIGSFSNSIRVTPVGLPVLSNVRAISGDQNITLLWNIENLNGSIINSFDIQYRKNGDIESTLVSGVPNRDKSYVFNNLSNGVDYSFEIRVNTDVGFTDFTTPIIASPVKDVTPQIVGLPQVIVSERSASFTWQTNIETSTRVDFGLLDVQAKSIPELNTSTRVVNHSALVSNLLPCTAYRYRVFSRDSRNREILSESYSFTTSGCLGDVVDKVVVGEVCSIEGGTACSSENLKARIISPENITQESDTVIFQIKKLDQSSVSRNIESPDSSKVWLDNHAYKLSAYLSEDQLLTQFDNPVQVIMQYTRDDIKNINIATLSMYHYSENMGWRLLDECENDYDPRAGVGEISCKAYDFSIFGLFGEVALNQQSSGGGSTSSSVVGGIAPISISQDLSGELTVTVSNQDQSPTLNELPDQDLRFPNNLWIGILSTDVIELQKFLNEQGFTVAVQGPGSPGFETPYFGQRTLQALKKFQTFYSDSILKPAGITQATGYFGLFTRMFVNQNF